MTFRLRAVVALLLAALIPLVVFALGVRRELTAQLARGEDAANVRAATAIRNRLSTEGERIASRLRVIAADVARDPQAPGALGGDAASRAWLIDYAGTAMRTAGLDMLQIQDSAGTVLSAGQFRNLYGQHTAVIPARADSAFVLLARTPSGSRPTLARAVNVAVAGDPLTVVGGTTLDSAWISGLVPDSSLSVALRLGRGADSGSTTPVAQFLLPVVGDDSVSSAAIALFRPNSNVAALRVGVTQKLAVALALSGIVAAVLALVLGSGISRPVRQLTERAEQVDLGHLDVDFASGRADELGRLSNALGDMQHRLQTSATQLREAERQAATGELARQVNHDIKNGLAPIRNVLRHLSELATGADPAELQIVYLEREATLTASVAHLDALARTYAQLAPGSSAGNEERRTLADTASEVVRDLGDGRVSLHIPADAAHIATVADPVAVRRILHNLIANALESLTGEAGTVEVTLQRIGADAATLSVVDTGRGMSAAELDRAFQDFHTTKPSGTGLGLSSVRRLVLDLGGSLRASSNPDAGSRLEVTLPLLPDAPSSGAA